MRRFLVIGIVMWVWLLLVAGVQFAQAQNKGLPSGTMDKRGMQDRSVLIMFWNLENYFDPFDDSLTDDEEFLPQGYKHWTWKKFEHKRDMIAKTILTVKDDTGFFPAIIGFAEVENRMVLNQLVRNTALVKIGYEIFHRDSPDRRGIDVALIYRTDDFLPICTEWIPVFTAGRQTRDILYTRGVFKHCPSDTLDIFVVHWPSKFGGEKVSIPLRMQAAKALHGKVNSLNSNRKNIIVMGDFNDMPESVPIKYMADSAEFTIMGKSHGATPTRFKEYKAEGTLKYKGKWELIDNFLLFSNTTVCHNSQSGTLQKIPEATPGLPNPFNSSTDNGKTEGLNLYKDAEMFIFNHPMLLEKDNTFLGYKPFRTYYGPRWNKGVSDHLPILLLIH